MRQFKERPPIYELYEIDEDWLNEHIGYDDDECVRINSDGQKYIRKDGREYVEGSSIFKLPTQYFWEGENIQDAALSPFLNSYEEIGATTIDGKI
jgi:hypothetical protein